MKWNTHPESYFFNNRIFEKEKKLRLFKLLKSESSKMIQLKKYNKNKSLLPDEATSTLITLLLRQNFGGQVMSAREFSDFSSAT